jgi:hypothetical protein
MKVVIPLALLLGTLLTQARELALEAQWHRKDLSPQQQDELVERSKVAPFEEIGQTLLATLVEYRQYSGSGLMNQDKPWHNDRYAAAQSTYLMARTVWVYHMRHDRNPTMRKTLVGLLQRATTPAGKLRIMPYLAVEQWCPEAEPVLADIANDSKESADVRTHAVRTLLRRCDVNKYISLLIRIALDQPKGGARRDAFFHGSNAGNQLFAMDETNRRAFLSTGFSILTELPEERVQDGYFVARHLGFVLRIDSEFTPDQSSKEYQGEHGLLDKFFADTTRNALLWYSKNKKTFEGN